MQQEYSECVWCAHRQQFVTAKVQQKAYAVCICMDVEMQLKEKTRQHINRHTELNKDKWSETTIWAAECTIFIYRCDVLACRFRCWQHFLTCCFAELRDVVYREYTECTYCCHKSTKKKHPFFVPSLKIVHFPVFLIDFEPKSGGFYNADK